MGSFLSCSLLLFPLPTKHLSWKSLYPEYHSIVTFLHRWAIFFELWTKLTASLLSCFCHVSCYRDDKLPVQISSIRNMGFSLWQTFHVVLWPLKLTFRKDLDKFSNAVKRTYRTTLEGVQKTRMPHECRQYRRVLKNSTGRESLYQKLEDEDRIAVESLQCLSCQDCGTSPEESCDH